VDLTIQIVAKLSVLAHREQVHTAPDQENSHERGGEQRQFRSSHLVEFLFSSTLCDDGSREACNVCLCRAMENASGI
jgi:hypothetical protein